ncbi:MAG TPA: hypothetical protein VFJ82_03915 [Longimicrobium sp.]|nr:hypothetical protein [Longimicrobium sp.]
MKTEARGLLLLLGTLALGVLLGAAGNGTLQRERRHQVEQIRRPGGFQEHMLRVIRPRDDAQRNAILPAIQATDRRNAQIIHAAHEQLRAALDSMRAQIAPQLDADQRARLDEFARMVPPPPIGRGRPGGPGGPGMGGPGGPGMRGPGGPPRDGWGPPPGGPPPPREGDAPPPAQPR